MVSMVEYAKRIQLADKLICNGCKWPIVRELLQLRQVDAQRLARERFNDRKYLSRIEKGMYWWRMPGKYNIRMIHADYLVYIHNKFKGMSKAERLLNTYLMYNELVTVPVIDNINRIYYLLSSVHKKTGFVFRQCSICTKKYIAIGLISTEQCFSCERNQYMRCIDCGSGLDNPYRPGSNGNKKRRCGDCAVLERKKQRIKNKLKKQYYLNDHKLY